MVHPLYLVHIMTNNQYTDGIKQNETVRIYLKGRLYLNQENNGKNKGHMSDDSKNYNIVGGVVAKNIVQITIKNMELSPFNVESIIENIKFCEMLGHNYYSLYDVFKLLKTVEPEFNVKDVSLLDFYNHQQFIVNPFGTIKRVFYQKKEALEGGDNIVNIGKFNDIVDNVMIFIYNTSLVHKGKVRLNKKYGTIYTNLDNLENSVSALKNKELIDINDIDEVDFNYNKIYNLKSNNVGSEIYVMSIYKLKEILEGANNKIEKLVDVVSLDDGPGDTPVPDIPGISEESKSDIPEDSDNPLVKAELLKLKLLKALKELFKKKLNIAEPNEPPPSPPAAQPAGPPAAPPAAQPAAPPAAQPAAPPAAQPAAPPAAQPAAPPAAQPAAQPADPPPTGTSQPSSVPEITWSGGPYPTTPLQSAPESIYS
jgi:hypothetical protein